MLRLTVRLQRPEEALEGGVLAKLARHLVGAVLAVLLDGAAQHVLPLRRRC